MKQIYAYLILLWAAGAFAACAKEDGPEVQKKRVTVNIAVPESYTTVTRAVVDNRLFNLCVMVFDSHGVLFSKKTVTLAVKPSADYNILTVSDVFIEDDCRIYAVANMGHSLSTDVNFFEFYFESIVEESDLLKLIAITTPNPITTTPTVLNSDQACIMTGQMTVSRIEDIDGAINISLKRINAKLRVIAEVKGAALAAGMTIEGVRVINMPGASHIIPREEDYPVDPEEYYTSDWLSPSSSVKFDNNGSPIHLFENHRGTGPNKSDPNAPGTPPAYATYVNIATSYNGQKYIYKVYLGNNNSTDYNVDRNTFYTLTVNINGVNNIATDVRVVPYDDSGTQPGAWYITDGMLLHYDGIKNNGDDPRVTNVTTDTIYAAPRPAIVNNSYYNYDALDGGYTYVETNSPRCNGKKNRWRNIAPMTKGRFNMPIWHPSVTNTTAPNCWGGDCFMPSSENTNDSKAIASMEFDDDLLRPSIFTVECVFMSNGFNVAGGGNDLFGFFYQPFGPRFVTADVEVYKGGLGMIAGGDWNGQNFGAQDINNMKRRVVIQFDGQKLIGWYGRQIVYTEPKNQPGDIPWGRGKLGAAGNENSSPDRFCAQLNLGTWARHNTGEAFRGKIYAFRFYNRLLTEEELNHNFNLDKLRFGLPEPK